MRPALVRSQSGNAQPIPPGWRDALAALPDHILEAWEERAAIIQYEGGEPRPTAERRAFECVIHDFTEAAHILKLLGARGGKRAQFG